MTQQFKFGDRVRIKDEPLTPWENAGIIFAIYGDEKHGYYAAVCFQESDDFQDVPLDEIEPVPHPDTVRLDWLADRDNHIGNVQLPAECVEQHLDSMRDAIDAAMRIQAAEAV